MRLLVLVCLATATVPTVQSRFVKSTVGGYDWKIGQRVVDSTTKLLDTFIHDEGKAPLRDEAVQGGVSGRVSCDLPPGPRPSSRSLPVPNDARPVIVARSAFNPSSGGKASYLITALATELQVMRWSGPQVESAAVLGAA